MDKAPAPFSIGQKVFMADYTKHEKWITCPDCGGSKHVLVILHDKTEVTIECGGCDPGGYQPSTGMIRQYQWEVQTREHTVTAIKTSTTGVEYDLDNRGTGWYCTGTGETVFATKEEALVHGETLRQTHEDDENHRLLSKTKDDQSWKRNAAYHRHWIAQLERKLEYHRTKVQVCTDRQRTEKAS